MINAPAADGSEIGSGPRGGAGCRTELLIHAFIEPGFELLARVIHDRVVDDIAVVENKVTMADFHGTVLRLRGLDHRKVTFDFEGRDESLIGVEPAQVVNALLA